MVDGSERTTALPNCALLYFHQNPAANAATITMPIRSPSLPKLRGAFSASSCPNIGADSSAFAATAGASVVVSSAAVVSTNGAWPFTASSTGVAAGVSGTLIREGRSTDERMVDAKVGAGVAAGTVNGLGVTGPGGTVALTADAAVECAAGVYASSEVRSVIEEGVTLPLLRSTKRGYIFLVKVWLAGRPGDHLGGAVARP